MEKIFNNTQVAFSLKSDTELDRAYFLFKMIANQPLVRIGTAVTNFALKANLPVEGLIRATVFDHFCGGINEVDCLSVVDKMHTKGVSSILDYSVEGKEEACGRHLRRAFRCHRRGPAHPAPALRPVPGRGIGRPAETDADQ